MQHHARRRFREFSSTSTSISSWLRNRFFTKNQVLKSSLIHREDDDNKSFISRLHRPSDFDHLTQNAVAECNSLQEVVLHKNTDPKDVLRALDDISNTVCKVIDVAELYRHVHPESVWREAATSSFSTLSNYIQDLNTNVKLFKSLKKAAASSNDSESARMASLLIAEFERDGIHLPLRKRSVVSSLQHKIMLSGFKFQSNLQNIQSEISVPKHLLRPIPSASTLFSDFSTTNSNLVSVSTSPSNFDAVMKWVKSSSVREEMYRAANTCAKSANLPVLDSLRKSRHDLALALGYESYAHLATSDKMAQNPDNAIKFLTSLSEKLMGKAGKEKALILKAKKEMNKGSNTLNAWDVPYYTGMLKARNFNLDSRIISQYFSLPSVLEGLNLICNSLFELQLVTCANSLLWQEDVKQMNVCDKSGKTVGVIYLDLYPRQQKYNHAAHFTIQCGIRDTQVPHVALVTNFIRNNNNNGAQCLLSHSELETLFHEFGHAIHSILSETSYQHLSGTRAALDFVETPSHLFEYFAWDHRVVSKFAKHHVTGEVIPKEMLINLRKSKYMFGAMDAQAQILYSLLDLKLFQNTNEEDSTELLRQLQNEYTVVPFVSGTAWHSRFGHVVGYGAGYYSYVVARVFASHVWRNVFDANPLSASAGKRLRQEVLCHGGSKDPMEMIVALCKGKKPDDDSFLKEVGVRKRG